MKLKNKFSKLLKSNRKTSNEPEVFLILREKGKTPSIPLPFEKESKIIIIEK
jgi:RIO-like serine/threonine protein kinase